MTRRALTMPLVFLCLLVAVALEVTKSLLSDLLGIAMDLTEAALKRLQES